MWCMVVYCLLIYIYICNLYSWRGPRDRSKGVLLEEML